MNYFYDLKMVVCNKSLVYTKIVSYSLKQIELYNIMLISWHGNMFHINDPLCEGDPLITSNAELPCFNLIKLLNIAAGDLRCHDFHMISL